MVSLHQAKVHIFISVVISFSNGGDVVSNRLFGGKQTTDTNGCYFKIIDIEKVKHQFTQLSTLGNVQMIRFNVDIHQNNSVSANSEYFQNLNELHSNGLERWMWMLKKHSHLLTYSPDFEVVTLNRSTSIQRNIYIPVEAYTNSNTTGESHYKNCTESLFFVIFKELLNQTNFNSDWLFCHRYFEGQKWKLGFLYKATGAWIGYDFECFSSNCKNTRCAQHIEKGRVNVIINIWILVVVCYFPLLFLLLPKRTVKKKSEHASYSMGDQPFSLTRYIFKLNSRKIWTVSDRLESFSVNFTQISNKTDEANIFTDEANIFTNEANIFTDCLPEISLISVLYLIVMFVFFIQRFYFPKLIPDFNRYVDVYHPCITYNLLSDCDSEKHSLDLILGTITTIFAPMYFLVLSLIYIHSDNTYLSLNRSVQELIVHVKNRKNNSLTSSSNSILVFEDISPNDSSRITGSKNSISKCTGYTKLAMKFLDRISIFVSSELWKKLLTPPINCPLFLFISVPLNVFLYVTCLLVPIVPFLLDILFVFPIRAIWNYTKLMSNRSLKIFVFVFLYLIVISIFTLFFFSPYFVYILQSILRTIIYTFFVAGPLFSSFSYDTLALVLAISLYVIKYVVNFYQIYKNLLDTLLKMQIEDAEAKDKQPTIRVDLFKLIVDKYVPLRTQLVMLLLKVLVTSLFLYVAIDTLGKVGKEDLFTSPIPALVATIMPILAEKLCSSDPQMEIKLQKDFIQKELRDFKHTNEPRSHFTITAWMIVFPAFYTILRPVVSLFDTLFSINNGKVEEKKEETISLIINEL